MLKIAKLIQRAVKDEEGTALVEYSILLGVVAVACVALAVAIGGWSTGQWQALCNALSNTTSGANMVC